MTAGFGVLTREDSSDDKGTQEFYLGLTRKDDIGNAHIRGTSFEGGQIWRESQTVKGALYIIQILCRR